jgi:putative membrane protein
MNATFAIIGSVFAAVAALVHLAFFALESLRWSKPSTWKQFGVADQRDAEVLRPMAYNQGFYNLFLAVGTVVGLVLLGAGVSREAGFALAIFALASMLLAAVVLITSNPRLGRGAVLQGGPPLLGLIFLTLALLVP